MAAHATTPHSARRRDRGGSTVCSRPSGLRLSSVISPSPTLAPSRVEYPAASRAMREVGLPRSSYPPISDYGFIADCHTAALVSNSGSIDWCCMPRYESGSYFGRLLGWERGGYCLVHPRGRYTAFRKYLEGTLVLETTFRAGGGEVKL